mmetsp:Transcript_137341/g.325315  ORF Transcript_137341/g.325315 Transcript_137341/m.325315 type:complete len:195 (+) Transcript_137341:341-925(+)
MTMCCRVCLGVACGVVTIGVQEGTIRMGVTILGYGDEYIAGARAGAGACRGGDRCGDWNLKLGMACEETETGCHTSALDTGGGECGLTSLKRLGMDATGLTGGVTTGAGERSSRISGERTPGRCAPGRRSGKARSEWARASGEGARARDLGVSTGDQLGRPRGLGALAIERGDASCGSTTCCICGAVKCSGITC